LSIERYLHKLMSKSCLANATKPCDGDNELMWRGGGMQSAQQIVKRIGSTN